MSSKQWVEWVHGKKDAEEEKPVLKKKAKPEAPKVDKPPVEPSPSEPED